MAYNSRGKHPGYGRDGKRLPYIEDMSADAIEREFIEDAIAGHETPLQRYVSGVTEIADKRNTPIEDTHRSIVDEVERQTGFSYMPGTV